jgi:hypothetical protein
LLGRKDHAAAAFAELFEQLVAPDALADGVVGRVGQIELERGAVGWRRIVQGRAGVFLSGPQVLEPLAQGRGAFAPASRSAPRLSAGFPGARASLAASPG